MKAFGQIETYGLISAIEATDVALKSANVELESIENITGAIISVTFRGEVGALKAAIDAGSAAGSKIGKVLSANVIPRLDRQVDQIVKNSSKGLLKEQKCDDINKGLKEEKKENNKALEKALLKENSASYIEQKEETSLVQKQETVEDVANSQENKQIKLNNLKAKPVLNKHNKNKSNNKNK